MIKVAGVWEHGWGLNAKIEYDIWHFALRTYAVDQWYMSPVMMPDKGRLLTQIDTVQDAIDQNPDFIPVFVDENGETDLLDFQHPENGLYIFGRNGQSPWKDYGRKGVSVKISVPVHDGLLWGHQCVPLVLQHRHGLHTK